MKAYYQANAEEKKTKKREHYKANAERIAEADREYRKRNAARISAQRSVYYRNNIDRVKAQVREYARTHPDVQATRHARRRAHLNRVPHETYSRAEIFAAYDNECVYCGAEAAHLDHVVPISKGGADAAHNLLPACANCNLSKGARSLAEWALTWLSSPQESLALKAQHNSK